MYSGRFLSWCFVFFLPFDITSLPSFTSVLQKVIRYNWKLVWNDMHCKSINKSPAVLTEWKQLAAANINQRGLYFFSTALNYTLRVLFCSHLFLSWRMAPLVLQILIMFCCLVSSKIKNVASTRKNAYWIGRSTIKLPSTECSDPLGDVKGTCIQVVFI